MVNISGCCLMHTAGEGPQNFQSFCTVCVQTLLKQILAWKSCKVSQEIPERMIDLEKPSMFQLSSLQLIRKCKGEAAKSVS